MVPIPRPTVADPELSDHIDAVAQTLDRLTGQETGVQALSPLPLSATLPDVIAVLNELIRRVS